MNFKDGCNMNHSKPCIILKKTPKPGLSTLGKKKKKNLTGVHVSLVSKCSFLFHPHHLPLVPPILTLKAHVRKFC